LRRTLQQQHIRQHKTSRMITVSQLYIYPVKSLGGIAVAQASLTDRGFEHDRRWMLVDTENRFLSQRELPTMALLQTSLHANGIQVSETSKPGNNIIIPWQPQTNTQLFVSIWEDSCKAIIVSDVLNEWFTQQLKVNCKLVYMPDASRRKVDTRYASQHEITSFSDGYPILLVSQASLNDLNQRLDTPVSIQRFRPNLVISGCLPYQEDEMAGFTINDIQFFGVKLCARCVVTTINPATAAKEKEPLKTLAGYRQQDNKIFFGQNVLFNKKGHISIGDILTITNWDAKRF
jgi:uncharacterized protein